MYIDLEILDLEINYLKQTLYNLLKCKELTNKDVVKCSEELDMLILEYERQNVSHEFTA